MVTINQNNNLNVNLESIEEILKIIADAIAKPSKYFIDKIKSDSATAVELNYETKDFHKTNHNINNEEIYDTMNSIAGSLKKNKLFYDEYFDFCEIQDMTQDTLNRDESLIKKSDLEFLLQLVSDFSEIINFKISLIENEEFADEKYESEYNSYLNRFNKSKNYFYENICEEDIDEDLFIEYANTIIDVLNIDKFYYLKEFC